MLPTSVKQNIERLAQWRSLYSPDYIRMHFTIWNHNGQVEELIDALAAAEERSLEIERRYLDKMAQKDAQHTETQRQLYLAMERERKLVEARAALRAIPAEKERA